ncbi:translation elongation factor Ts [Halorhodospira halochloris]|uniref:Elongation factor Ts n=1 Tax=Halorhodospira halochloris TaxID=1052 RepID=A0A0X8X8C4_HALHR|nr:translation elongation factor Ts [Halorhodospira halochloris]MBK1651178.1 elongation factor Ts [Halorhodospira halochloris]MCG5547677.1 translation elongation factor Ts [Halorhodospira halochloris]BAU57450.1 translation elongation factor Ts [Halorhodospira halochloris]
MSVSASLVKQLRERTGSGMMECKNALVEADGDIDAAAELMRKKGLAKADKKAGRVTAEGRIVAACAADRSSGVLVEINSETDFVANGDEFREFAEAVAQRALEDGPDDLDGLLGCQIDGKPVETLRQEMVAQLGENIEIRRFVRYSGASQVAQYLHGARIGVLVEYEGGDEQLGKDLAMHVAASSPICVSTEDVPQQQLESEREILMAQARESGKPEEIIQKMVEGRLNKHLSEITLLGQPFVKDPDQSVADLLKDKGAKVVRFARFEVGEGKEKKEENFADEVMAQVRDS